MMEQTGTTPGEFIQQMLNVQRATRSDGGGEPDHGEIIHTTVEQGNQRSGRSRLAARPAAFDERQDSWSFTEDGRLREHEQPAQPRGKTARPTGRHGNVTVRNPDGTTSQGMAMTIEGPTHTAQQAQKVSDRRAADIRNFAQNRSDIDIDAPTPGIISGNALMGNAGIAEDKYDCPTGYQKERLEIEKNPVPGLPMTWEEACDLSDPLVINVTREMIDKDKEMGAMNTNMGVGPIADTKRIIFLYLAAAYFSVVGMSHESKIKLKARRAAATTRVSKKAVADVTDDDMLGAYQAIAGGALRDQLMPDDEDDGDVDLDALNADIAKETEEEMAIDDVDIDALFDDGEAVESDRDDDDAPGVRGQSAPERDTGAEAGDEDDEAEGLRDFFSAIIEDPTARESVTAIIPYVAAFIEFMYDPDGNYGGYRLFLFFMHPRNRMGQDQPLDFNKAVDILIRRNLQGELEHRGAKAYAPIAAPECYRRITSREAYLEAITRMLPDDAPNRYAFTSGVSASMARETRLSHDSNPAKPTKVFTLENALNYGTESICHVQRDMKLYKTDDNGVVRYTFPLPAAVHRVNFQSLKPSSFHDMRQPYSQLRTIFEDALIARKTAGIANVVTCSPAMLKELRVTETRGRSVFDQPHLRRHNGTNPKLMTDDELLRIGSLVDFAAYSNVEELARIEAAHDIDSATYRHKIREWKSRRGRELLESITKAQSDTGVISPAQYHCIAYLAKNQHRKFGQFFQLAKNLPPDASALAIFNTRMTHYFRVRAGAMQRYILRLYFGSLTAAHYWNRRIKANQMVWNSAGFGKSHGMKAVSAVLTEGTYWSLTRVTRSAFMISGNYNGMVIFLEEAYPSWFGMGDSAKGSGSSGGDDGTSEFKNMLTDQKVVVAMCRITDEGERIQIRTVASFISVFHVALNTSRGGFSSNGSMNDVSAELSRFMVFNPDYSSGARVLARQNVRDMAIATPEEEDMPAFVEFRHEMRLVHSYYNVLGMFIGAKVIHPPNNYVLEHTLHHINRSLRAESYDEITVRDMEQLTEFATAVQGWTAIMMLFCSEMQFIPGVVDERVEPIRDPNDPSALPHEVKVVREGMQTTTEEIYNIIDPSQIDWELLAKQTAERGNIGIDIEAFHSVRHWCGDKFRRTERPSRLDHKMFLALEPYLVIGPQQTIFTLTLFASNILPTSRNIVRDGLRRYVKDHGLEYSFPFDVHNTNVDMRYIMIETDLEVLSRSIAAKHPSTDVTRMQIETDIRSIMKMQVDTTYQEVNFMSLPVAMKNRIQGARSIVHDAPIDKEKEKVSVQQTTEIHTTIGTPTMAADDDDYVISDNPDDHSTGTDHAVDDMTRGVSRMVVESPETNPDVETSGSTTTEVNPAGAAVMVPPKITSVDAVKVYWRWHGEQNKKVILIARSFLEEDKYSLSSRWVADALRYFFCHHYVAFPLRVVTADPCRADNYGLDRRASDKVIPQLFDVMDIVQVKGQTRLIGTDMPGGLMEQAALFDTRLTHDSRLKSIDPFQQIKILDEDIMLIALRQHHRRIGQPFDPRKHPALLAAQIAEFRSSDLRWAELNGKMISRYPDDAVVDEKRRLSVYRQVVAAVQFGHTGRADPMLRKFSTSTDEEIAETRRMLTAAIGSNSPLRGYLQAYNDRRDAEDEVHTRTLTDSNARAAWNLRIRDNIPKDADGIDEGRNRVTSHKRIRDHDTHVAEQIGVADAAATTYYGGVSGAQMTSTSAMLNFVEDLVK